MSIAKMTRATARDISSLLREKKSLGAGDQRRNAVTHQVLALVREFAQFPSVGSYHGPSITREETCVALSLGSVLDVDVTLNEELDPAAYIVAGGKAINHFRAGQALGTPIDLVSLVSNDATGQLFVELLASGVPLPKSCRMFQFSGQMRVNIHPDNGLFASPGPTVESAVLDGALREFREVAQDRDWILLAGSLYPGIPETTFFDLLREYGQTKKVVLDSRGMWNASMFAYGTPFILKPNIAEFCRLVGSMQGLDVGTVSEQSKPTDDEVVALAMRIAAGKNIPILIISKGGDVFLVVAGSRGLQVSPPQIELCSDIGSGDALITGIIDVLSRHAIGRDVTNISDAVLWAALRRGTAFAACCAMQPGSSYTNNLELIATLERDVHIEAA